MANKDFSFNFSDIPDDTIEPGNYMATVEHIELRTSDNSGLDYLNWEFNLTDAEHLGRKVWMILSLSPKALFRVKQTAEVLGFEEVFAFSIDEDNMVVEPDFNGMEVELLLENREYQGKVRTQVKEIVDYFTAEHLENPIPTEDPLDDVEVE